MSESPGGALVTAGDNYTLAFNATGHPSPKYQFFKVIIIRQKTRRASNVSGNLEATLNIFRLKIFSLLNITQTFRFFSIGLYGGS